SAAAASKRAPRVVCQDTLAGFFRASLKNQNFLRTTSGMKIVLLVLSGDRAPVIKELRRRYPDALLHEAGRAQIEELRMTKRVQLIRSLRPDILCVVTERLAWQRGQNAFLLLGALSGARRTIILDSHRAWHEESRAYSLLKAPACLA